MPIFIEDNYMNQIKACLAFPDVDNLLLSDEQIKDICIAPALREYFSKFPIKHEYQEPVGYNEEKTVSFPDSYVFGVLTCCVSDIGNNVIGNAGDYLCGMLVSHFIDGLTSYFVIEDTVLIKPEPAEVQNIINKT